MGLLISSTGSLDTGHEPKTSPTSDHIIFKRYENETYLDHLAGQNLSPFVSSGFALHPAQYQSHQTTQFGNTWTSLISVPRPAIEVATVTAPSSDDLGFTRRMIGIEDIVEIPSQEQGRV